MKFKNKKELINYAEKNNVELPDMFDDIYDDETVAEKDWRELYQPKTGLYQLAEAEDYYAAQTIDVIHELGEKIVRRIIDRKYDDINEDANEYNRLLTTLPADYEAEPLPIGDKDAILDTIANNLQTL